MDKFDASRPNFTPYGFSCVRWTPTRMPRCDRHNEIELNLLESGSLVYLMGGRKVVVPAGQLTVFWAGIPHQILDFDELADYFVVTIPLAWFLQWRLPDSFTQAVLHGETVIEPDEGRLQADKARFDTWNEDVRNGGEERCNASLLEIQARLRRLAISVAEHLPLPSRRKSTASVEPHLLSGADKIAGYIAQNYTEPLTAEKIGRHVGLHPNYAMALFRQTFGTTLIKYVTEHRLSHAQQLLVTTRVSILDIAFSSGFGSLSRFNETFRQSFRCTPREYRRIHQRG